MTRLGPTSTPSPQDRVSFRAGPFREDVPARSHLQGSGYQRAPGERARENQNVMVQRNDTRIPGSEIIKIN